LKFWEQIKLWHAFERMVGNLPDTSDIMHEFHLRVGREIEIIKILQRNKKTTPNQELWLAKMQSRIDALQGCSKYKDNYVQKICAWGASPLARRQDTRR